jgi:hypothetical protein
MEPKSPGPGFLLAPGASGSAQRLPGARTPEAKPRLDEHLVREETREEMVRGQRVIASPAKPPHADRHCKVDYVISAHAADGYIASTDLLTRAGPSSEFATDTSVRRDGIDPSTDTRYLEELAFEVVSEQSLRDITERAEDLSNRGVRRLIAIFVKKGEVAEWSAASKSWVPFPVDGILDDPTLARPMAIRALLDAAVADDEVVDALHTKGNRRLAQYEAQALAMGITKGITALCEAFGIPLGPSELAHMRTLDSTGLEALLDRIKTERRWPAS